MVVGENFFTLQAFVRMVRDLLLTLVGNVKLVEEFLLVRLLACHNGFEEFVFVVVLGSKLRQLVFLFAFG